MIQATSLSNKIIQAIRSVVGSQPVALHEPTFAGNEWLYLKECLDSTYVSSVGKFVNQFESELVQFTGAKHAVAVVNGTSALHIALKLVGVQAGDEVLLPAMTFVATANAISYCGAIPHLVDCEEKTLGVDSGKLRNYLITSTEMRDGHCFNRITGRLIRAIVPMHTFGHPVAINDLLAVARDFNLQVVEDAAESLGSFYRGQHTGTFGRIGVLSFNGNKTITTGGGGALLTNEDGLAQYARHLTTTAKLSHPWEYRHDKVGYNYRMPNLNAALGCAQIEQLPALLEAKRSLFRAYQAAFSSIEYVSLVSEPRDSTSNYWLQTIMLDSALAIHRDVVLEATNAAGFMTRPVWLLMNELPPFQHCPRMDLSNAQLLAQRIINIPSSAGLWVTK
jgi:perosamine synthetase